MIQRARLAAVGPSNSGSGGHATIAATGLGLGTVGTVDGIVEQAESTIRHAAITGGFITGDLQFQGVGFGTGGSTPSGGLLCGGEIGRGIAFHRIAQLVGRGDGGIVLTQRRLAALHADAEAVAAECQQHGNY